MVEDLCIRPARPEDRAAMERICAHTWDSGDYIQEIWDDWLAGEDGLLLVAELGGQVVSLNKVTIQPAGQIWLEGMRVDPEYRGRGIASRCLDWNLAFARERGARVVRLATGSHNTAVHLMTARVGMDHVGTYILRTAEPLPGGLRPAIPGTEMAGPVAALLENGPVLAKTRCLYSADWAWQELSARRLVELLDSGQVVARVDGSGNLAAVVTMHHHAGDDEMWIGVAEGQPQAVADLAMAIRAEAAAVGVARVRIMLPELPWLREAFQTAGFGPGDWDGEMWLMERFLGEDRDAEPGREAGQRGRGERGQ